MLAVLALAALSSLTQSPSNSELRAALDALREEQPGEARFEAAKPRLVDLLASRSGFFVEGAAYLIGIHGFAEFAPDLVEALRVESGRTGNESKKAYALLLDALIQLEHAAPAEWILAGASEEHAELVYLALGCETNQQRALDNLARFVALGMSSDPAYWAAAIELTLANDVRIVEELLVGAPWELEVGLRDSGSDSTLGETFWRGVRSSSHPQWPPLVSYRLTLPARDGALDEIRHERTEHARSVHLAGGLGFKARADWRKRLLRELHPAATPPLADEFEFYADNLSAISRIAHERANVLRTKLTELAHEFARAGLLSEPEKLCRRLSFRVELRELRSKPTAPLVAPADTELVRFVRR